MPHMELLAWIVLGFTPVIGVGIFKLSRYGKGEDKRIPWEI